MPRGGWGVDVPVAVQVVLNLQVLVLNPVILKGVVCVNQLP